MNIGTLFVGDMYTLLFVPCSLKCKDVTQADSWMQSDHSRLGGCSDDKRCCSW